MTKQGSLSNLIPALIVMALWGSLYPIIKLGYKVFEIDKANIGDIMIFAALRFLVCGLIISVYSIIRQEKIKQPITKNVMSILFVSIFSVILLYSFNYIGLSLTEGSKAAIFKQIASLLYICFSFLFIQGDVFRIGKIIGAILGFLGIVVINYKQGTITFTWGDGFILLASFCTVIANIIGKNVLRTNSPILVTGISQLFGGIILFLIGMLMGGVVPSFSMNAIPVFVYLCIASTASYCLWYSVLQRGNLSMLFIVKFSEPLFACILSALILNESVLELRYLIGFVLICTGICLGQRAQKIASPE